MKLIFARNRNFYLYILPTLLKTGKTSPIAFATFGKSDKLNTKDAVTKEVMASYDFVIAAFKAMTEPQKWAR